MKKFDIITEADARVLERGSTLELSRGGHVTPLAADTLRERRITVVEEGRVSGDALSLAPAADIRSVAIASDQSGMALRTTLVSFLRGRGLAVYDEVDAGITDYAVAAARVAQSVVRHEADAGIVIDRTGIGSAIAANKIPGIRAATAASEMIARSGREHHGVNVLTLGATLVTEDEARAIVSAWLSASIRDPDDIRRLAQLRDLERRGGVP